MTGYTFGTVNYAYDAETLGYFTNDELKLGSSHVHDLKKTEAKDATCTEAGNKEYWTCSRCEKVFSDEAGTTETTVDAMTIAALGHEMVHTEANEATCTEAGNKEYWTCSRCEKVFSDEAGTTETTVDAMTIAALGHEMVHTEANEATCTEAGNKEYWTCSRCEKVFSDEAGTTETTVEAMTIAAKGHDWSDWVVIDEATEEKEGLERRTCRNDESHTEERVIPKLTHKHEMTHTAAVDATCTEPGNIEYWTCSGCGKLFSDENGSTEITENDTVIAALGHDLKKTEAKDATCTEAGNKEYWTCSRCEKVFSDEAGTEETTVEEMTIAALGHDLKKTEAKDATCTEAGNKEYWTCSRCEKVFSDEAGTKEITEEETVTEALGHDLKHTEAKEATCTEAGNKEYWTCSRCGKVFSDEAGTKEITEEETVTEALGHDLKHTEAKEATCTEAGNKEYWTCSRCEKVFSDEAGTEETTVEEMTIAALGHDLKKTEAKEATCTEAGNKEYWTCSRCEKVFSDEAGTTETTVEEMTIAALGHDLKKTEAKDATCTEAGNKEYWTCSRCEKVFSDEAGTEETTVEEMTIAALGHDLKKTEAKDATCTEAGNIEYWTCSGCGKLFSDEAGTKEITEEETVTEALGHDLKHTEAKDATCTEAGNIEYWTCSRCGETFSDEAGTTPVSEEETLIEALGHKMIHFAAKDATCTENGSKEYWTCNECGKLFSDEAGTEEISASDISIAAKGHSYGDWVVTKEATRTEAGSREKVCSVCGDKITEVIPRISGTWRKDSKGWWYQWSDTTYPKSTFETIDGKTYYFNASGYMVTGWQAVDGKWYYFNGSGAQLTGWQQIGGKWYYLSPWDKGAMVTGWQKLDGKWYFFNSSGAMVTGWQKLSGYWYYFNGSGAMVTGWQKISGTWYYFNANGVMLTNWQKLDGKWYYFNSSGAMVTGWRKLGGTWYYFTASGALQ